MMEPLGEERRIFHKYEVANENGNFVFWLDVVDVFLEYLIFIKKFNNLNEIYCRRLLSSLPDGTGFSASPGDAITPRETERDFTLTNRKTPERKKNNFPTCLISFACLIHCWLLTTQSLYFFLHNCWVIFVLFLFSMLFTNLLAAWWW